MLSSTQLKIESGEIENVDDLKARLQKLYKNCDGLYSRIFLDNFIAAAPAFFELSAKVSTMKNGVQFSPTNETAKTKPNLLEVKNLLLDKALKKTPECESTRNNNPVFTLISDHPRPRFQTVLQ